MAQSLNIVWITGAGGLIGSHIAQAAPTDWTVRALQHAELDLTDFPATRTAFQRDAPKLIIHCAALSSIAACDADPKLAWRTNVEASRHLAELASDMPLFFFSTDLVFDGRQGHYAEDDAVHPLTPYAESKVAAEQAVLANPRHTVIRTALTVGRSPRGDRACNEQLELAWKRGETTRLFVDEFRSPIPAEVTARAIWELVAAGGSGLFHLGGSERVSRFALGQLIAERCPQLQPRLEPAYIRDSSDPRRPPDTSLDVRKIQELLSFPLPCISEWLRRPTPP